MDPLEKVKRLLAKLDDAIETEEATLLEYQIVKEVPWLVTEVEQLREALGRAARKMVGMKEE